MAADRDISDPLLKHMADRRFELARLLGEAVGLLKLGIDTSDNAYWRGRAKEFLAKEAADAERNNARIKAMEAGRG